jgi:hypothetical protein
LYGYWMEYPYMALAYVCHVIVEGANGVTVCELADGDAALF